MPGASQPSCISELAASNLDRIGVWRLMKLSAWWWVGVLCGATIAQTPPASQIVDRQVTIPSNAGTTMPGVWSFPARSATTAAVVVFVEDAGLESTKQQPGSDPPINVLAHALAAGGIANLRYGSYSGPVSTNIRSNGLRPGSTIIEDAVDALRYASDHVGAGPHPEFLLAEGVAASLAPYISEKYANVRGIILVVPSVLPIESFMAELRRIELADKGKSDADIREQLASQNRMFADIREGKIPAVRMIDGAAAATWLDWMNRNPVEEFSRLNMPILVLQGDQDAAASEANEEKLQKILAAKGRMAEFHSLPLSHPLTAIASPRDSSASATVDPQVTATII